MVRLAGDRVLVVVPTVGVEDIFQRIVFGIQGVQQSKGHIAGSHQQRFPVGLDAVLDVVDEIDPDGFGIFQFGIGGYGTHALRQNRYGMLYIPKDVVPFSRLLVQNQLHPAGEIPGDAAAFALAH